MRSTDIPTKFQVAFGSGASNVDITQPIPLTTNELGRASLVTGFPDANFQPVGAGGIPPWGADVNGLSYMQTTWLRFCTAIGGYPEGALITDFTLGNLWLSLVENNTTDPATPGQKAWRSIGGFTPVQQGGGISQMDNKVFIGWDGTLLRVTVDTFDQGGLAFQSWCNSTFATIASLAAEASTRGAADTGLATSISNEAGARYTNDTALQSNINSEATTRSSVDSGLSSAITSEATTRSTQDTAVLAAAVAYANGTTTGGTWIWPNAKIIKFGTATTATGGDDPIFFESSFPNGVHAIVVSEAAAYPLWEGANTFTVYGTSQWATNAFYVSCKKLVGGVLYDSPNTGFSYIAIGD
jgi:hypothetical protein